jgi:RNA polymerase sigma-54 factor
MKLGFDINIEQKLNQSQQLTMTPELLQAIKILQLNAQELDVYVEEQLLSNPLLEKDAEAETEIATDIPEAKPEIEIERAPEPTGDSDFDWGEYLRQREYDDVSYKHFNKKNVDPGAGDEDTEVERAGLIEETLNESLEQQILFSGLSENKTLLGQFIVNAIDHNGYLHMSDEEIASQTGAKLCSVEKVMDVIRTFEPTGVGARNLRECLLLQLKAMLADGELEPGDEECLKDAIAIVDLCLDDLAANRLALIAKHLHISVNRVQYASDLIKTLDPKPGRRYASENAGYIIPDAVIEKSDGGYAVTLNDTSIPNLTISSYYREVFEKEAKDSDAAKYLSERLNAALWLIKSVENRNQTIYNVLTSVVKHQQNFLDKGEYYLVPLTLKIIADEVGVHESTVSRSISGKYVQTPRGVFDIKYFFKSGVSDGSDEGMSSESVKALIGEYVSGEDKKSPLSDAQIAEMLKGADIDISRRTVAKYREDMGIQASPKRRRYE